MFIEGRMRSSSHRLWSTWVRGAVAVVAIAAGSAICAGYQPSLSPPGLHARDIGFAAAKASVIVDTPVSVLVDKDQNLTGSEAESYALYLRSDAVRIAIARAIGLRDAEISASGPFTLLLGRTGGSVQSAPSITPATPVDSRYRLLVDVDGTNPVLTLYSQAPTTKEATRIVDTARALVVARAATQARFNAVPSYATPVIRSLGPTQGGAVDAHAPYEIMGLVFVVVLSVGGAVLLAYERSRRRRTGVAASDQLHDLAADRDESSDDWPHTRRLLPWAVAVFLGMLFLMPFESISLPGLSTLSSPDRIVLIVISILWIASLTTASGPARSRTRVTSIHLVVVVFFGLCCASVALNGITLGNLGELQPVLKKLILLGSFVVFFCLISSVMRPREVPRFATLLVVLASITAIGTIIEYRLHYNPFYSLWSNVLPLHPPTGFGTRDNLGRLQVLGPTTVPLELAALIAMALPFAVMGLMQAETRRRRVLYALAIALYIAAGLATGRKTAIIGPAIGFLVLLAYRPRAMLRGLLFAIPPLGVLIHVASPGALGSVLNQLMPGAFGSAYTTADRVARYDAIRPDVFSHFFLGRGFESYDPHKYRVLDNEFLQIVIGVGALGLIAYVLIYLTIIRSAHLGTRSRDPRRAAVALAGTSAITVALVANALFDTLSFAHVPYLVFFIGGMMTALHVPASDLTSPPRQPWLMAGDPRRDRTGPRQRGAPAWEPVNAPGQARSRRSNGVPVGPRART